MGITLEREYSIKETADILHLHPDTVYQRVKTKQLRARRDGKFIRVPESDLRAYIASTYQAQSA